MVSVRSRAKPSALHAVRNLLRNAALCSGSPRRCDCIEQTNGSVPRALCSARSVFQAFRSASVPASHHNGTHRERLPLVISRRSRRCGRWRSSATSSSCRPAISETRSPQQQAKRTTTRLRRSLAERAARVDKSDRTVANSRRVSNRVGSRFHGAIAGMTVLRYFEM
jgi:hypothetical protein